MTSESMPPGIGRDYRTQRMEAFSDGVFAIAITLLVLEISVPAGSSDDLLRALVDQWPSYLAYVVSFSTVGAAWLAHTAITEHLVKADLMLFRLNLILLLFVGFLPFPTKLFAEYIGEEAPERVAVTVYGITLLLVSLMISILWRYAYVRGLVVPEMGDEEVRNLGSRLTPSLLGYLVLIGLGLWIPVIAVIGFLAIALLFIFPIGRMAHHRGRKTIREREGRKDASHD